MAPLRAPWPFTLLIELWNYDEATQKWTGFANRQVTTTPTATPTPTPLSTPSPDQCSIAGPGPSLSFERRSTMPDSIEALYQPDPTLAQLNATRMPTRQTYGREDIEAIGD